MNMIDPTYLRTIYDGLHSGVVHKDNASALPLGLEGIYEEYLPAASCVKERQKFLDFFSAWALLKKEVTPDFVSSVLSWTEEQVIEYILQFSKWFNSPVSGKYILYHERLRSYILMRNSGNAINITRSNLINTIAQSLKNENQVEHKEYAFSHLIHLLGNTDLLNNQLSGVSKKILNSQDYWENAYLYNKNLNSLQSQIWPYLWLASRKNDWELLEILIEKSEFFLSLNATFASQLCLNIRRVIQVGNIETIYENFYDVNYKLKFLILYTLNLPPEEHKKLIEIWKKASLSINFTEIDLLKSSTYWAISALSKKPELKEATNGLINEFIVQYNRFKKSAIESIAKSAVLSKDVNPKNINQILGCEMLDLKECFKKIFNKYPSDNLLNRDELITRDTLISIEYGLNEKLTEWIFWLLSESEFEQGPHYGWETPNAFLILFNLILKSDRSVLLNVYNRLGSLRLDYDSKLYVINWLSQHLFEYKMYKLATKLICDFNLFSESKFDVSAHLIAYINSISKPPKKLIKLLEPKDLFEIKMLSVHHKLIELEKMDPISKCEYSLELALQIIDSDKDLAIDLIERADIQAKSIEGWGGLWNQIAVLSSSLFIKDKNWIVQRFEDIKRVFRKINEDLDYYELAIEELFSNQKTRFSFDDNYHKILNEYDFIHKYFKRKYPDLLNKLDERANLVSLIRNEALNLNSIFALWERIKVPFQNFLKLENDFDFWSYIEPFPQLFTSFKKKDFKIVNRIVKKTEVRFPIEKFIEFNTEIKMYKTQFYIPDPWQLGKKEGLEGLAVHYKYFSDLDREVIIAAALDGDSVFISNNDSHKNLIAAPFAFALQIGINQPNSVAKLNNLVKFRGDLLRYETV